MLMFLVYLDNLYLLLFTALSPHLTAAFFDQLDQKEKNTMTAGEQECKHWLEEYFKVGDKCVCVCVCDCFH